MVLALLALVLAAAATVTGTLVQLDPLIVALIGGTLIPIATGILTKLDAASGIKAAVALVLSAAVGIGATIVAQEGTFDWKVVLISFGAAFAANLTSYLGVYKPITGQPPLSKATKNFGLGKPQPPT